MWDKMAAWWNGLNHGVQAAIVAFGGGIVGVVEPVLQNWASGQAVCSVAVSACLKGYAISAVKAGVMAVLGLYVKSSLYHKP